MEIALMRRCRPLGASTLSSGTVDAVYCRPGLRVSGVAVERDYGAEGSEACCRGAENGTDRAVGPATAKHGAAVEACGPDLIAAVVAGATKSGAETCGAYQIRDHTPGSHSPLSLYLSLRHSRIADAATMLHMAPLTVSRDKLGRRCPVLRYLQNLFPSSPADTHRLRFHAR